MVRYVRNPTKFEQDVKEFMVRIKADMTSLSHRIDNVGENLGILQNLTVSPVNEVSLLGRINKMEGQMISNDKLDARVATIEQAIKNVQDAKFWMDDHDVKWHEIDEYKDEVNKLKIHFETWNSQILRLEELTVIHEDPKSLINRLEGLETKQKNLSDNLVERITEEQNAVVKLWDERNRIVSRLDLLENWKQAADEGMDMGAKRRVELEERVEKLEGRLLNPMNWDITHIERLEKLEKRIKDFDGSNRSKPNWATVNQIEATIRKILDKQDEHDVDIRALGEEMIRKYRTIPDDNEMHQPTTTEPREPRPGTTEDLQQQIDLLKIDKARWESLEWKFLGLEKRMEETLKVANPMTCDRCGKVLSPQAIKQTDEENVCMMCRIDVLEAMIWHKPSYEQKEEPPSYNPNDPLPGEEKYDYATRISKLAMKRWDELYGKR